MFYSLCVGKKNLISFFLSVFLSQVRLQTQAKPKPGEKLIYGGTIDCFKKTLAKEVRVEAALLKIKKIRLPNLLTSHCSSPSPLTGCERPL